MKDERTQVETINKNVLENVNFTLCRGDFLVVIGKIGCGKTSLLYSIMNENVCT